MDREGERRTATNERGRGKGKIGEKNRGHEKQSRRRNNSKRVEPKFEKKGKRITKWRKRIEKERGGRRARKKEEKLCCEEREEKQKILKRTRNGVKRYLKNTKGI